MQKEREVLKTLIGLPERSTEEIQKQFDEDMQTYGNEKKRMTDKAGADKPLFDASTLYYQPPAGGHEQGHPGPYRRADPVRGPMWPICETHSRTARRPRMQPSTTLYRELRQTGRSGQEDRRRLQQRAAGGHGRERRLITSSWKDQEDADGEAKPRLPRSRRLPKSGPQPRKTKCRDGGKTRQVGPAGNGRPLG